MCWLSIGVDLARFESFKDAEFRSLEVISPLEMKATFAVQDSARDFDWITLTFEFSGVSDARLLESKKLPYVDMSDGISIIKEDDFIAFGIGECYNSSTIRNATCFIIANSLKTFEGTF